MQPPIGRQLKMPLHQYFHKDLTNKDEKKCNNIRKQMKNLKKNMQRKRKTLLSPSEFLEK